MLLYYYVKQAYDALIQFNFMTRFSNMDILTDEDQPLLEMLERMLNDNPETPEGIYSFLPL